ncbi:cysteine-rich and transmembrane domain-containing protein A-like isoform X2 [Sesamum indicum]|uniref:Cysteine-rich and transmembrane domain-containing protein A-like isoform X2 n=1 Tax=Sesamum indicum TaxID=4182 RepID=A0A6I9U503_SESIN|nr:cysteine-rich and transmembrane domain-containing protein A-like isoform X2 [Sesamum indicum]
MSQYNQQHQAPAHPPPPTSYPPPADSYNGPYVMAPPPMGYPTKDDRNQGQVPMETTSRGDGFLKGCLAGLCCCWCLDICF